jgi:two-component system, NtrC family, sensor kinase
MNKTSRIEDRDPGNPRRPWAGLAFKLTVSLVVSISLLFLVFGYLNLRLQRQHSEAMVLESADRISDVIRRSTHFQMLRNDREALYHQIHTLGSEPGIRRIRIFNEEGRISFSTDPDEVGTYVDQQAEACYACHAQEEPLTKLDRPDRSRIFYDAGGERLLGVIRPIENEPSCSNAVCHAHPPERRILGVIDADLSLATVDAQLAEHQAQLVRFTVAAVVLLSLLSVAFIWAVIHRPVKELIAGTQQVAEGRLDQPLSVHAQDELGELAASFNKMIADLAQAREELTGWNRLLEARVTEKSRELSRAHEQMLHVEKMASVGKLAAVVAHEINNPLSGILTYAKLLRRWLAAAEVPAERRQEIESALELIERESRRCGDIVRNLLMFSRAAPMNLEWTNLNAVLERSVRLVRHQLEMSGIQLRLEPAPDMPPVHCDPAQLEQVLLALVVNAIEAMPRGGTLTLRTRLRPEDAAAEITVADDGAGIPPDILPQIFEPFFSTKEGGHSTGLGLAVSRSIIERHRGRIKVASEPGRGTTFTLTLPLDSAAVAPESVAARERER